MKKEKYYMVDTRTGDTITSSYDKETLEECCYGDDMVISEERWHQEYEHVKPSYDLYDWD